MILSIGPLLIPKIKKHIEFDMMVNFKSLTDF